MNATSLAYSNAQNQHQKTSWIDAPFDIKGFVTGLTPMSNQKKVEEYAQELVYNHGEFIGDQYELSFDKLSAPFQLNLTRLYIESIDREIEWACYGEDQSINSDFICAMLAMLQDSTPKTRAKFAEVTLKNLVVYYKDVLQRVLDEACHDLRCNEMNEAGYHGEYDRDHGDFLWVR